MEGGGEGGRGSYCSIVCCGLRALSDLTGAVRAIVRILLDCLLLLLCRRCKDRSSRRCFHYTMAGGWGGGGGEIERWGGGGDQMERGVRWR